VITKSTGDMVKVKRNVLTGALVLGLSVPGVTAAGQLGAIPSAQAAPAQARSAVARYQPAMRRPRIQLGAGIDLYTYPGQNFTKASTAEIAYLKALHANSVTVSFPFFMRGRNANTVFARKSTPTPAQLRIFGRAALKAGIYVALRPLLSNDSIGVARNTWRPKNLRSWFSSYQKFLMPYAVMAQRNGIPRLYVGAEFQEFGTSPLWTKLDNALRRKFKGALAYANNGHQLRRGTGGKGVQLSADSYPDMTKMPANATVARLTKAWEAWDRAMPRGTVLSEVGIAAVTGAYHKPWFNKWKHPKINTTVQARWFTAACRAAAATHMGGIYFWAIGFGAAELTTAPSAKNEGAWEKSPAEKAAAACFKQIRR
jgi:hypothetical protein